MRIPALEGMFDPDGAQAAADSTRSSTRALADRGTAYLL
jgi:hypothetical protein